MTIALAYDVYGTLIDTDRAEVALGSHLRERAPAFSRLWRQKQLEYAFRRGLMRRYRDFRECTRDALEFACRSFGVPLSDDERVRLMAAYGRLPAFDDVIDGLERARAAGFACYAFSNGPPEAVDEVLRNAGVRHLLQDVVSVDEVETFKPSPAVYEHFLRRAGTTAKRAWLVSGNPFDVLGAVSAGMRAAWLKRTADAVFDPWELEPTLVVSGLSELPERIRSHIGGHS
jgi:2-haloacid dehalogenase